MAIRSFQIYFSAHCCWSANAFYVSTRWSLLLCKHVFPEISSCKRIIIDFRPHFDTIPHAALSYAIFWIWFICRRMRTLIWNVRTAFSGFIPKVWRKHIVGLRVTVKFNIHRALWSLKSQLQQYMQTCACASRDEWIFLCWLGLPTAFCRKAKIIK